MQNTFLNGVDIKVEPFDLTESGELHKLDLLYYNNVNRYGEILSSLAYNSGIRLINDTDLIVYTPNKWFLNSALEHNYTLTGVSNRWKNADLRIDGVSNFKDNSANATYEYARFNINSDYAIAYSNGEHAYDGWYTLVSVALQNHSDNASVLKGTLRDYNNTAQYALQNNPTLLSHWADLSAIDTSIDIYNFIREDRGDTYSSYDFMATVKTDTLYKKLLNTELTDIWFKKINVLSPKLRTLETAIEFKKYDVAQHIINAINNSLLSLLI